MFNERRELVMSSLLFCICLSCSCSDESLVLQCLKQTLRHGFIVLAGVATICEHLCQVLLLVDCHKFLILLQLLLKEIDDVQLVGRIVVICFLMNICLMWQAVGLFRMLAILTHQ